MQKAFEQKLHRPSEIQEESTAQTIEPQGAHMDKIGQESSFRR
jgi:hypothetical protein